MAIAGGILYIICFAGLLFTSNFMVACVSAFLAGVATSGFWDASLYPAAQESVQQRYAGSALIGIKFFVSLSGIIYPLLAVQFSAAGNWQINIWIPLVMSIIAVVLAVIAPFAYDDQMKETVKTADGKTENAAQAEIEAAKAKSACEAKRTCKLYYHVLWFPVYVYYVWRTAVYKGIWYEQLRSDRSTGSRHDIHIYSRFCHCCYILGGHDG